MFYIVALILFMLLLYKRWCPVIIMRIWFTICMMTLLLVSLVFAMPLHLAVKCNLLSKGCAESWSCCLVAFFVGKLLLLFSPHIRVRCADNSLDWHNLDRRGAFCMCHTSFFDTNFFLYLVPFYFVSNAKALAKRSLWNIPLLGMVIRACGHFPVYFNSEDSLSFSVDKEKQMAVTAQTEKFLANGGILCFFPEGALNRTPETLKDFRYGTFNLIVKQQLPIQYMVCLGCNEVWDPVMKGIPGFPADLLFFLGKYEYDKNAEPMVVAKGLREVMQKQLDAMIYARKSEHYVSPIKKYIS